MSAEALLQRLDLVRSTGPDRWVARCPSHDDRSPTLSIREIDDRTLVHCFAGCDVRDVLAAVGLDFAALFPPKDPLVQRYRKAPRIPYADALKCIGAECFVVLVAAGNVRTGTALSDSDMARLELAVQRIATSCEITGAWR